MPILVMAVIVLLDRHERRRIVYIVDVNVRRQYINITASDFAAMTSH